MSPLVTEIKLITLASVAVPSKLSVPNAITLQQSIEVSRPLVDLATETWAFQKYHTVDMIGEKGHDLCSGPGVGHREMSGRERHRRHLSYLESPVIDLFLAAMVMEDNWESYRLSVVCLQLKEWGCFSEGH
jgi:hypothetical protein